MVSPLSRISRFKNQFVDPTKRNLSVAYRCEFRCSSVDGGLCLVKRLTNLSLPSGLKFIEGSAGISVAAVVAFAIAAATDSVVSGLTAAKPAFPASATLRIAVTSSCETVA
jgi:hypothetical protein